MTASITRTPITRRTLLRTTSLAAITGGFVVTRDLPHPASARQDGSGTLRVGATGDRNIAEPPLPNVGMTIPNPNIFETLIMLDGDFQLQPGLAESWEFVEPNTWRFKLREGVTFHDGTPFTAEAVEWTMKRVAESGGGVLGVDENSTKIIDDYTVEITPVVPNLRLPLQMSGPRTGSIIAPGTNPAEVRIGTGPFREVEYVPEEHHLVEKFAEYWGEPAKVDQIDFRFLPDPTTRLLALEAGEVDLIYDVPRDAAPGLRDGGTFELAISGVGAYQALAVNIHGDAPYELGQDPIIRAAVAMAIDKQIIADAAWQGFAVIDNGMIPAAVLGAAEAGITRVPYDPAAAAQLLEDAGWAAGSDGIREKDGRRLQLELISGYPTAEIQGTAPELVQAQLREIGVEVTITQISDSGAYNDRLVERAGDLWMEVGNQVDADPCYLPALLYVSPDPDLDDELNSYSNAFAPGAEFDAAIAECGESATQEGVQEAAAKAMNVMISQHIVMPLVGIQRIYALAPKVEGFVAHPVQFLQRWDVVSLADV
jgi:peptide/nickel transport system substrate-binding protein